MQTITKRELNHKMATVLDGVTEGNDVVVTERGKPRWTISVVAGEGAGLDRLQRDGRYTPPAASPAPWPDQADGPAYSSAQVDALLDEIRGEH